ncbi:pentapeptide repeat-containing protein [Umezawaea tangerina]|uniref:Pentapeptide repeat protein n=1 Tax=Umezawaea tangerina TaxID=84725 RepID=A0A2T0SN29_9PSEU|nr:pentapeptide repeat-containing protein [Umezawaea tangerina]PRY34820.1 pentapeptide repeat protein [Umezawaea tangerina]
MSSTWLTALFFGVVALVIAVRHYRQGQADTLLDDHARRRTNGEADRHLSEWREAHRRLRDGDVEGLRTLERIGQEKSRLRQDIVTSICAGLRGGVDLGVDEEWRRTLQDALVRHLRPGTQFWAGMSLQFESATLVDFDVTGCRIRAAKFSRAEFLGTTRFDAVTVTGDAEFDEARFGRRVSFDDALFARSASFRGTKFTGNATFDAMRVTDEVTFSHSRFSGRATFPRAEFAEAAHFRRVRFGGRAYFTGTVFGKDAVFDGSWFRGRTDVNDALFADGASFEGTRFGRRVPPLAEDSRG